MSPQIEKQQFQNATDGWIGAVSINVKGEEIGVAVEPGGTVWLSEAEQILTANAPRLAADNPFIPQKRQRVDPLTGEAEEVEITPLVPINEGRFVPANERPIPSDLAAGGGAAQAAATGAEPVVLVSGEPTAESREAQVLTQGDDARPNVPPPPPARAAAAAAAAEEAASTPTTEEPPVTPETPAPAEETAAQSPGPEAEETGAATQPIGDAPQGEFAALEEVGTPDAPSAPQQPPAPWSPGSEG